MGKLIIDGNKVYEIDEECLEKKRHKEQEERKREWEQKWERNREKNSQNSREKNRKGVREIFRKTGTASAVPVSDCRISRKARSIHHRIRCRRSRRVIRLTINSCCCRYRIRHRYHCCRIRNSITG